MSMRKDKVDIGFLKLIGYEFIMLKEERECNGNFVYTKVTETWKNRITNIWIELYYTKDYERIDDDSDKNFLLTTGNY